MSDTDVAENDKPFDGASTDEIASDVAEAQAAEATANTAPIAGVALETQLKEANDRVLRGQAELENFRKRARRELDEQRQYANLPLMSDLLPAIDNLDRALEAAEKSENASGLIEGIKMVAGQILTVLEQHHCLPIQAEGEVFDPNVHEAVAQESSEQLPAGSITRVLRVGYRLHDRVVRPAQVMISTGPAEAQGNGDSDDKEDDGGS